MREHPLPRAWATRSHPMGAGLREFIAPMQAQMRTAALLSGRFGGLIMILMAAGAFGQDPRTNAAGLKVFRDRVEPHWFAGNNQFWYRVELAGDRHEFIRVDAVRGTRAPAFDHERLARALSQKTGEAVKSDQLPFNDLNFSGDGKSVQLIGRATAWQCDLAAYQLTEIKLEKREQPAPRDDATRSARRGRGRPRPIPSGKSPDGKWEAVVRGHNLVLRDLKTQQERALTYDGNPDNSYAQNADRQREVEMEYDAREPESPSPEVYWSPDSRHLVAMRTRAGTHRVVYLVESSPKDQLQPRLQSYPYLKPGDEVPVQRPHLFDVEAAREIPIHATLFSNPWSIGDVRWSPDSSRFTFLYNQRGHQVLRIVGVDATTGAARAIVDERAKTFVDYSGKFFAEYLDDTGEIIWMSERDGWNHLYLYDAKTGQVKNQVTKGEWVVRGVERVDREKRQIWFRAGGIRSGQDPYFIHSGRVNFDGTGLVSVTEGNGTHAVQFSPDHRFFIDTWSRVDLPPVNELRRSDDGRRVCKLETADASALFAAGWKPPEPFVAKGRDGVTDIYGVIFRPKDFDPHKKYPVIENIYAGPQDSYVPKSFHASYRPAALADLGFVVVQIDGMGTSNRSKKFHDVCWQNLGDAGFPDRVLWIKAAVAKYPSLDATRVGIYGTSAGGQNALGGLLTHGDFYKVGVADSGCHDNRMDKIWWNEQWMGWPVGPPYAEQSNVTLASRLRGKLLLMVGELDKNVDPSSTMQVVNALIQADKDFELLVMPGAGHGVAGTPYGQRRLKEFFVRNLLGNAPGVPAP